MLSAIGIGTLQQELDRKGEYDNFARLHSGLGYDVPSGSYCGERLTPTFRAVPQLAGISLPHSSVAEAVPQVNQHFIHRHTALVLM